MISTRTHGLIDYGAAALLGSAALCSGLPSPVRRLLGVAGGVRAGYAALTDYEGGFYPRFGMRKHLAMDAAGAVTLGIAGLLMKRQPAPARALLLGIAAAELMVVALSSPEAAGGPSQGYGPIARSLGQPASAERIGYPPLDMPKPVAPGVDVVDSVMPGVLGAVLPVRMTVLRLPNGELLLHSPTPFTFALKDALEAIGPIRHLVAPSISHWMFLRDWQRACPEAITWAVPVLRRRRQVRQSGLPLDRDLIDGTPSAWGGAVSVVTVPGGLGFQEAALFHHPSGTLVLTDLVLNLEEPKVPPVARPVVRMFGSLAPEGRPPPYLRGIVRLRRRDAAAAALRILALQPERVVFAHGQWFERDGSARLRQAWRWLLE
ncbi:MAG TPA: DUF4336 domain-containing protein [Rhodopila sp.]|nr:DUF4336 domain-containing protein [Rhodopila sp.]